MRFRIQVLAWGVLLGLSLAASSAGARDEEEKAKEAFKSGSELFEQEQFSAAAIQFRIAYKYKPTWKLLYNIGQCETGAKRYGLALEAFEQYLVESGDDIPLTRREEVRSETTRLREMVGSLKVTGPAGTEVFVDGVKRGNLPLTGYVPVTSALEHTVSGILNGKKMEVFTVKVLTGQVLEIHLTPLKDDTPVEEPIKASSEDDSNGSDNPTVPPADNGSATDIDEEQSIASDNSTDKSTVPQPAASPNDKSRKLKMAGFIFLGAGGASLIASAVTGPLAMKKDDMLQDRCLDGYDEYECVVADTGANNDLKKQRDVLGGLTTGLWIGGGAAVAAGAVLLILSKKKREFAVAAFTFQPIVSKKQMGGAATWNF